MELLIVSNISLILSLLFLSAFINKLSEKPALDLKRKIIITIILLFIVNYIYYFTYDEEGVLLLLNILIMLGTILLIIISLGLAIFKKKSSYLKIIFLGILFLILPFFTLMIIMLRALPKG